MNRSLLALICICCAPFVYAVNDCRLVWAEATKDFGIQDFRLVPSEARVVIDAEIDPEVPGTEMTAPEDLFIEIGELNKDGLYDLAEVLAHGRGNGQRIFERLYRLQEAGYDRVSLSLFLPPFARGSNGRFAECDGPDCFNAVVKWFDPTIDVPDAATMNHLLGRARVFSVPGEVAPPRLDPIFRELRPGETLEFGDVAVFLDGDMIIHAAIYQNIEYLWHKPSRHEEHRYSFAESEDSVGLYLDHARPPRVLFYRYIGN